MDGSIGFSTTQSVGNYLENSFNLKNKLHFLGGTSHTFFSNFVNNIYIYMYINLLFRDNSRFYLIPIQNGPSSILVGPKLGEP